MRNIPKMLLALLVAGGIGFANESKFSVAHQEKAINKITMNDDQVKDLVVSTLGLNLYDGKYSDVGVTAHDDHYVVYLFEANTYNSECFRFQRQPDGNYIVIKNYTDVPEDAQEVCGTCPDESIRILVSGSFSDSNHVSRKYVKKAYTDLNNAGFKVKELGGSEENRTSVLNWLSCKNLILWGRIGHGAQTQISFAGSYAGGSITPSDLGKLDLTNKLLVINSCQVHNANFIGPVIDQAHGKFFSGGDSQNLQMNSSEAVWHNIVLSGVKDKKEFGELVTEGNNKLSNNHKMGFTRNQSCNGKAYYDENGSGPNDKKDKKIEAE